MRLMSVYVWLLMLSLLFRRKYPRWWFEWNLELEAGETEGEKHQRGLDTFADLKALLGTAE